MALKWIPNETMTLEQELDAIKQLSIHLRSTADNTHFGTKKARSFIIGQSGEFIDRRATNRHPMTLEWVHKCSKMMGQYRWDEDKAIDKNPNTIVELFKKVSDPSLYESTNNYLWDYGVVFARSYDILGNVHYPQTTTVFEDDSSVLRDIPTVIASTILDKISYRAWVKYSPTSKMTDEQLIEKTKEFILEEAYKIFSNRFVIVPEVFLSPLDELSGRSWTIRTHIYANKNKDTAYTSVNVYRMSDLQN